MRVVVGLERAAVGEIVGELAQHARDLVVTPDRLFGHPRIDRGLAALPITLAHRVAGEHERVVAARRKSRVDDRHHPIEHRCDPRQVRDGAVARVEPLDPELRGTMLAIDRECGVVILAAIRCEPQRVKREQHGVLAVELVTVELDREPEIARLGTATRVERKRRVVELRRILAALKEPRGNDADRSRRIDELGLLARAGIVARHRPRDRDELQPAVELLGKLADERVDVGNQRRDSAQDVEQAVAIDRRFEPDDEERERDVDAGLEPIELDAHQLPSWRACQSRNSALNSGSSRTAPRCSSVSTWPSRA